MQNLKQNITYFLGIHQFISCLGLLLAGAFFFKSDANIALVLLLLIINLWSIGYDFYTDKRKRRLMNTCYKLSSITNKWGIYLYLFTILLGSATIKLLVPILFIY